MSSVSKDDAAYRFVREANEKEAARNKWRDRSSSRKKPISFRQIAITVLVVQCAYLLGRWGAGGLDWSLLFVSLGITGFVVGVAYMVKGLKKPSNPEEAS